jgi:hypothetical protein
MAIKRKACDTETGTTSRPLSTSSAAAWTSIRQAPDRSYPRETRKDLLAEEHSIEENLQIDLVYPQVACLKDPL